LTQIVGSKLARHPVKKRKPEREGSVREKRGVMEGDNEPR